ncbi:hypothetical protein SAMD00019534_095050 [Acytostelium subglobosum LB1]|uniref:hypothetical protein n=1 Tax=Acytostelium subglobosum LB1 TaxID=1410327 RepID=UPI0006451CBD|nr:hypothetical protein SAMD00019534_095050 [Acytostelium subglobosum LB1]GAM26330.1 hypothetical protein SAMD00019534_095050 [Acytostelium subglobosum LB1]|eukprot:XP_012750884.1 hypothetical protein SAMD00019534_095050 [Acytostelium subglobosum LB1]
MVEVTLPDGRKIECDPATTTPYSVARSISKGLASRVVVALVNGQLSAINKPIKDISSLTLLDFDNDDAKRCFWWTTSIIMARSALIHFGEGAIVTAHTSTLTNNALHDGCHIDMYLPADRTINEADIKSIHTIMSKLIQSDKPFTTRQLTIQEALNMFKDNIYYTQQLNTMMEDGKKHEYVNVVDFDGFVTLDVGLPTMPSSGHIKAFDLVRNSSVVGTIPTMASLQRLVGVSFPDKEQMTAWKDLQHQAAQLDHRHIGRDQQLFFFHPYSPGSCFFLPLGTRIYNRLHSFLRSEYRKRGYEEVITPNIYSQRLWETSGHWQNYKDNMFSFQCDHTNYSLKPMNCPGHCLMFSHRARSYKELPLRIADFGVLHRNETHGSLTGLTRVRRFQQDDAHIFCTTAQIRSEIKACLDFMQHVYGIFGFTFSLELSTRPTPFLGDVAVWDAAEQSLESVLNEFSPGAWRMNPGDGAFYGPKIDIHIKDANGKSHQCATIQLDFQLPIRFKLEYASEQGVAERPVMVHRAIFGSTERMMAILIEHTKGKWPFWISPRQVFVASVTSGPYDQYAQTVRDRLFDAGYHVDIDVSDKTIKKKLRDAITDRYNYMIVIGKEEQDNQTISIRHRDTSEQKTLTIDQFLIELKHQTDNYL